MIPIRDTIPSRHKPLMIRYIITANIFVFLLQFIIPDNQLSGLVCYFGFIPREFNELLQNQPVSIFNYYPLITGVFLHGGLFHLISNMWALWIFGDNVEDLMGHSRFLVFYLLCGIIANFAHFIFNATSPVPAIGASGAIAGVMGAYLIMFPYSRIVTLIPLFFIPFFIDIPAIIYLLVWFLTQIYSGAVYTLFDGRLAGGIAWWAHIGGFIGGAVLHKFFLKRRSYRYI